MIKHLFNIYKAGKLTTTTTIGTLFAISVFLSLLYSASFSEFNSIDVIVKGHSFVMSMTCIISELMLPSRPEVQSQTAIEYKGIHFIYLTTQTVNQSTVTQKIDLENFGIKLYLPPNSFSEPVFAITVGVGISGSFVSPKGMTLVSAVYYIRTSSELLRPVTVEIEHCVILLNNNETSSLKFGKADTDTNIFKKLPEGTFPVGQSWGTIQISSFCLLGIFCDDNDNPPVAHRYLAGVLSHHHRFKNLGRFKMVFLATRGLHTNKEVYAWSV